MRWTAGGFSLQDLGTAEGTFLGGERLDLPVHGLRRGLFRMGSTFAALLTDVRRCLPGRLHPEGDVAGPRLQEALQRAELAGQQRKHLVLLSEVRDSERFQLLRGLEFFTGFGDIELWEVVRRARWRRYKVGHALYKRGQEGNSFHILAKGEVEVFRDGQLVATLGQGTSVGEMAYLAPNPLLRKHSTDIRVSEECTTISFTPETLAQLSRECQHRFDRGFIQVLVRRLHAAHESLAHPRRIL